MSHRDEYEVLESGILEPLPDDTVQSFESYDVVPVAPIVTRELSKIVFHETTKHLGSVLDYLAILAWNRVVMRVVGGPTRTTIDVLMTRQFHGLQLVWTWVYTVWVSSVCVATVRWSVGKRLRLEDEERRIENRRTTPLFSRRFVAFTHRRLAGACTYVAMWAWAVALLGSAPCATLAEDSGSVLVLSLLFALVANAGARGFGPLGTVLKVTTEENMAHRGDAICAEDVERITMENEIAAVTKEGVRLTCEWILAVAWVGAARRGADTLFGLRNQGSGLVSQVVGWGVALLAVGCRFAFLAVRAAGTEFKDDVWAKEFKDDVAEVTNTVQPLLHSEAETRSALSSHANSPNANATQNAASSASVRSKLNHGVAVAKHASAMLAGAFAFTAGVALNAAAQSSWLSVSSAVGVRRGLPSAVLYATVLSTVTVYAATYAHTQRESDESGDGFILDGDASGEGVGDGSSRDGRVGETSSGVRRVGEESIGDESGDRASGDRAPGDRVGDTSSRDKIAAKRKRRLLRELAVDEEKVGAFIAGFVWNAAFSQAVGDDGINGWPWLAAVAWTAAAAGYAAAVESWREVGCSTYVSSSL